MSLGAGLLDKKLVGYFVASFTATLLLVAMMNSLSNSEDNPMALNAVGFQNMKLGLPRTSAGTQPQFTQAFLKSQGIGSSAMSRLAIAGIDEANQCRDISAKASMGNNGLMHVLGSMNGPAKQSVARMVKATALKAEEMTGVLPPTGFFDPLGFSTDIDEGKLLFYREVELKHGRICMLAALGILVGENFHPLFGGNIDAPAYIAFQQTPLQFFWPIVVLAIAVPEVASFDKYDTSDTGALWVLKKDVVPGDLEFDPLGLKPTTPAEFKEMQNKELNNGRLAMIAAAGMIAQELATGGKIFG